MKILSYEFQFENVTGFLINSEYVIISKTLKKLIEDTINKGLSNITLKSTNIKILKDADAPFYQYGMLFESKLRRLVQHNDIVNILVYCISEKSDYVENINLIFNWVGPYDEYNQAQSTEVDEEGNVTIILQN